MLLPNVCKFVVVLNCYLAFNRWNTFFVCKYSFVQADFSLLEYWHILQRWVSASNSSWPFTGRPEWEASSLCFSDQVNIMAELLRSCFQAVSVTRRNLWELVLAVWVITNSENKNTNQRRLKKQNRYVLYILFWKWIVVMLWEGDCL